MPAQRCLYCYQSLPANAKDFHERCSRKFFGTPVPPELDYDSEQMQELAKQIVIRSIAVTGVQPKISLALENKPNDPGRSRFTIVGLWGGYILKPPTPVFPFLPENEDLTMHLAALFGITTAEHSLIRLRSGELAYLTKRFDRINGDKLPLEDMCQLTETLTADKYRGSVEKIGKQILQQTTYPGFDAIRFFELTLFCYVTGNADMHLKNFSLLTTGQNEIVLSPAYNLLCTKMAIPEDKDEMALTLNGKKRKMIKSDFDSLAKNLKIPQKTVENVYNRFAKKIDEAKSFIDASFLTEEMKRLYMDILMDLASKIDLLPPKANDRFSAT